METTATRSSALSVDIPPEVVRLSRPEVAPKPVITRQPSVLAPYNQIRTDEGSLPLLSVESPNEPGLGSAAKFPHSFHPEIGTGNRNPHDVIHKTGSIRTYILQAFRSATREGPNHPQPQATTPPLPHTKPRSESHCLLAESLSTIFTL